MSYRANKVVGWLTLSGTSVLWNFNGRDQCYSGSNKIILQTKKVSFRLK